jgi:hypothetical protein
MCIHKVCNGMKIKDFRQINTCHQVSLVVNLFKKVTFRVFIFLQYRYLVHGDSISNKINTKFKKLSFPPSPLPPSIPLIQEGNY